MNHYFLVSSLPLLQLGHKPLLSLTAFLTLCETHLTPNDHSVLLDLLTSNGENNSHPFAREWLDRETELRNEIARFRSQKKPHVSETWHRTQQGARVFIQAAVANSFQAPDPLERERSLDQLRWTILDELAGLDPFSTESVFSYGLRLRMACRWAAFDQDSGLTLLEHATASVANKGLKHAFVFIPKQVASA